MSRSGFLSGDYELDFDDDFGSRHGLDWPMDEAELAAALEDGQSLGDIARRYGVSVAEVAELVDMFDLG